jgi:hypothetical protein
MRDGMNGNPEESLRQALAEYADETGMALASERVRARLRQEVRARARRRWTLAGLAAAAAVALVTAGVTLRPGADAGKGAPAPVQVATERQNPVAVPAEPALQAAAAPVPAVPHARRHGQRGRVGRNVPAVPQTGEWRRGDVVLTPWYYNTALPPAARSVMVRSEVDARTAMRFGVTPTGDTAPVEILFGEDGLPRAMRFVRRLPSQQN